MKGSNTFKGRKVCSLEAFDSTQPERENELKNIMKWKAE